MSTEENKEDLLARQQQVMSPDLLVHSFESSPDATLFVDASGKIIAVNKQAELLLGYHRSELVGESVDVLVPDTIKDKHKEHRAKFADDPRVRPMGAGMVLHAKRKDGSTVEVEINLSPVPTTKFGMVTIANIRRKAVKDG